MRGTQNRSMELMRGIPLFDECSRQQLDLLSRVADEVRIPAGTVVMAEGEESPRECLLVIDGLFEVTRAGQLVAVVGPGELIGEMSMLDGSPRRMTATSVCEARVFAFSTRGFDTLMHQGSLARRVIASYREREFSTS